MDRLHISTFDNADWNLIPRHMQGAVKRYFEDGIEPGDFLTAVLRNDLRKACIRADDENKDQLFSYVQFFYMYAPAGSWGSPENYQRWLKEHPSNQRSVEP